MHTETTNSTLILNNMQQQHYLSHLEQDQLMPEPAQQQQQHNFTHLPSSTNNPNTSLNAEGLYAATTQQQQQHQQHLTSACPSQFYTNGTTTRLTHPATNSTTTSAFSSLSSSSSSSSSSNDSSYNCPNSPTADLNCKNNNKNNASIGVNLRVTGQCSQGGRKYMEDYFSVAYQQSENAKDLEYAFIGIYDGHGGAEAAKFAKEHLMMEIINQRLFWSDNDHDVLRAIREGYIATHYAMWREQDKWPKTANGLPSTAGTTATVAFIRREKIYIGHVGDSGIVLGYQNENENFWRAKQLTTDHKPESVEERTRIMNSGGKVVVKSGVPRVVWNRPRNASHRGPIRKKTLVDEIPFLAVARSLGDLWSYNSERNEFVVSPDPDVKVIPINSKTFRCLIFGTDGLWNVVSAQEAVNTVRYKEVIKERLAAQRGDSPQEGNQCTNPSKSLVDQALRTWSIKKMRADNTSVVTVMLYPPGQSDHNTNAECKESSSSLTNPPDFVQPISYGLEYTQVQAEVPAYDDATTYKEMALKYLPPEAYRNFNYYADESDTEGEDNEESEEEEQEITPGSLQNHNNYQQHQQHLVNSNNWNWPANNSQTIQPLVRPVEVTEEEAEDEEEEEEEEEDEDDMEEESIEEAHLQAPERPVCIVNYQNYVHMEAEETNNATDSYINTFAESYNSILTASQEDCLTTAVTASSSSSSCSSNSNSNSNSNCQSVTPPNMHDILQEQQLYQQQCMSEEEGYSLTKLETRREQQSCKTLENRLHLATETAANVQTFKIFHEATGQQEMGLYQSSNDRYYPQQQQPHQQQEFISHITQKPLELHSLLQQEREEEQQVAYERLQMESKLQQQHQNINAYACLQTVNSLEQTVQPPSVEEVEYLEEESALIEELQEEEITSTDSMVPAVEEMVQINEISSSSCEDSSAEEEVQETEVLEKIEILPTKPLEEESEPELIIAESEVLLINTKYPLTKISKNSICPPPTAASTSLVLNTPLKTNINLSKRNKTTYLYANVPNENNLQRISNSKNPHMLYAKNTQSSSKRRRSMCMTPGGSSMTPPAATSTPMIQRQLRSTSNTPCSSSTNPNLIDYGKRTLRTRNSLAKEMKAKNTLVTSTLKYPHNAVTRNFLRNTAANLMLLNEQHLTPCSRRSLSNSNSVRSNPRASIKTRRDTTGPPHPQLNLRSRQITATPAANTPNQPSSNVSSLRTPPAATSTPVIKRASLTERRILRSMHTRSSSSKSSQTPANFSKSTRTQSTGSNLAAPPPSPKLINAAAAVAAATRARSLLNAKHNAANNGTQSVVSAVFGKRTSLRSNVSSHPAALNSSSSSSVSPAATHQTLRGRIVKKLKR
ncbi:uncharacterized protein LOC119602742 [Lucilia sericata]|uniref:uncharacterized protein LOC119602742 n=1 Tax=Lucilia sericata TaxID=13632 RepID=UPI0018A7FF89|nr:uncharacterized protein LOC119602742 [Lucilia sericata]